MKLLLSLAALFAVVTLSGCTSSSSTQNPPVTETQRVEAMRNDKSLPAPAQARMNAQIEAKQKMDAMRAADAAKSKGAP